MSEPLWRLMPDRAGYQHAVTGEVVSFDAFWAATGGSAAIVDETCDRVVAERKAVRCWFCLGTGVHDCPGGTFPGAARPMDGSAFVLGITSIDVSPGAVDAAAYPADRARIEQLHGEATK